MKLIRLVPAVLLLALSTGCATILHGSRQDIRVETDPPGATASADGETVTTPGVLKISRLTKTLMVLVEREGYVSQRVPLTRRFVGAGQGNWLFGLVGGAATSSFAGVLVFPVAAAGIDLATGAAYRLEPSKIFLRLEPVTPRESVPVDGPRCEPPADREFSQPTTNPKETASSLSYDRPP